MSSSVASTSSTNSLTDTLNHHAYSVLTLPCLPAHPSGYPSKSMHICFTFEMPTVNCFFQTNSSCPPPGFRHLSTAQLEFGSPLGNNGIKAYSDDDKMSIIHNLVTHPSKINTATFFTVNFNYQATLLQSQIVIEDDMLIFQEPVCRGSSYIRLHFVPAEFFNIMFVAFHLNAISGSLNAYKTLHHIRGCTPTSIVCAMMPVQVAL